MRLLRYVTVRIYAWPQRLDRTSLITTPVRGPSARWGRGASANEGRGRGNCILVASPTSENQILRCAQDDSYFPGRRDQVVRSLGRFADDWLSLVVALLAEPVGWTAVTIGVLNRSDTAAPCRRRPNDCRGNNGVPAGKGWRE